MKKRKMHVPLLARIVIAIALGILFGNIFPAAVSRIFITFNALFSQFLGFIIPLIIVGLVTPAIADLGRGAGKMLLITVAIAYVDSVASGLMSYLVSANIFPKLIDPAAGIGAAAQANDLKPFFTITIVPPLDVMTALVAAFMMGLGINRFDAMTLRTAFNEFKEIITWVLSSVIVPLLPLFIFGIFLNMTYSGQAWAMVTVFAKIIVVIFIMHVVLLLLQYGIAGGIVKRNPLKLLYKMMPAYFTALGTSSSAATIPVTLKATIKNGVDERIAGFTIPLCATIHLSGSEMKITACAVALMIMQGIPFSPSLMIGFVAMLAIFMVAAPGVPGGAIMAALGLLGTMLHFDAEQQALMIALYIAMDSFGTACNVTGDGAIALVIDKMFAGKKEEQEVIQ
jgi:Na+/H+-dicarboxylate symporter